MDDPGWKGNVEKIKVVQKCPRCGKLSLQFQDNMLQCTSCGYRQNIGGT